MAGAVFLRTHWLEIWSGNVASITENIMISRVNRTLVRRAEAQTALANSTKAYFSTSYVSTVSLTLGTGVNWNSINETLSQSWERGELVVQSNCEDWNRFELASTIRAGIGSWMADEYLDWCEKFSDLHGINESES